MKPRYEIHSIGMSDMVEPVENAQAAQRDRAARALFAATEMVNPNKLETEFGRTVPQAKHAEYTGRYQAAYTAQVRRLATQLSRAYEQNPQHFDLVRTFSHISNGSTPRDAWGTELRAQPAPWNRGKTRYYFVQSAGADQQFDTSDDLAVYVEVTSGTIARYSGAGAGTIDLQIEHDRGPFNGHAEITGTVKDQSGAVIPGATIQCVRFPMERLSLP